MWCLAFYFGPEERAGEGWGCEGLRVAGGFFCEAPPAGCTVWCSARLHSYSLRRAAEMEGEGMSASPLAGSRTPRCHRHRRSGEKNTDSWAYADSRNRASEKSQSPGLLGASVPSPRRSLRVRGGLGQHLAGPQFLQGAACWPDCLSGGALFWARGVHEGWNIVTNKEEVHITSLNFRKSSPFLPELQNWAIHLLQLLKPFILPPWPYYKYFWRQFCLFLFYLFRLNLWKIIVNHRKIIKMEKSNFVGLRMSRFIQWTYNMVCFNTKFCCGFRSMHFCNQLE
jgi:hypothetical protein